MSQNRERRKNKLMLLTCRDPRMMPEREATRLAHGMWKVEPRASHMLTRPIPGLYP